MHVENAFSPIPHIYLHSAHARAFADTVSHDRYFRTLDTCARLALATARASLHDSAAPDEQQMTGLAATSLHYLV